MYLPYRAIVKGRLFGVVATRNMFVAEIEVVPPAGPGDWFIEYLEDVIGPLQPYITTSWTVETVEVQGLALGKWETLSEGAWNYGGNGAGDTLPNAVAIVLLGKALGLRKLGRKFFSGIVESATTANGLIAAAALAAANSALKYISPLTDTAGQVGYPGILDKTGTFQRFIAGSVSSLLGSMRRRKPGLGI